MIVERRQTLCRVQLYPHIASLFHAIWSRKKSKLTQEVVWCIVSIVFLSPSLISLCGNGPFPSQPRELTKAGYVDWRLFWNRYTWIWTCGIQSDSPCNYMSCISAYIELSCLLLYYHRDIGLVLPEHNNRSPGLGDMDRAVKPRVGAFFFYWMFRVWHSYTATRYLHRITSHRDIYNCIGRTLHCIHGLLKLGQDRKDQM